MFRPNIEIEVLRATRHASAYLDHVRAADQERNLGSMQRCYRSAMKLIAAAFIVIDSKCRGCACGHYPSITHLNRATRAWVGVFLRETSILSRRFVS